MLTITATSVLVTLPSANAHKPAWNFPSWTYVVASPNPIGIGQQIFIVGWLSEIPITGNGQYGDRWTFYLDITSPSGENTSIGPITSDPIGTFYKTFTPTEPGNYIIVARFIGGVIANANPNPVQVSGSYSVSTAAFINDTYSPSQSDPLTLVVQSEPIQPTPETPLPTDYWQRPIESSNHLWNTIAGNWLATTFPIVNGYQPYSAAPNTAHILWNKPSGAAFSAGGVVGGSTGIGTVGAATDWYTGSSYEQEWNPPIIINGVLYYNAMDPVARQGFYAVDLQTGKTLYYDNITGPLQNGWGTGSSGNYPQLSFGQILDYESVNQNGAFPYLWSTYTNTTAGAATGPFPITRTIWDMYDATSGTLICTFKNVPASSGNITTISVTSPVDGSLLIYVFDPFAGWLAQWNSSTVISYGMSVASNLTGSNVYWEWRPYIGTIYDGRYGYDWNVTIPKNLPVTTISDTWTGLWAVMNSVILPDGALSTKARSMILGSSGITPMTGSMYSTGAAYSLWALSLDPKSRGQLLWRQDYKEPFNVDADKNMTISISGVDASTGIFTVMSKESMQMYGYSLANGNQVWGPTASESSWQMFGMRTGMAYGMLYVYGQSGEVYCYNMTTGEHLWTAATANGGLDAPFNNYPFGVAAGQKMILIADGKIYLTTDEHSDTLPLYKGWSTYCWDAYTGTQIWNLTGFFGNNLVLADGKMVTLNTYDQEVYCFGKGLSATTVMVSPVVNSNSKLQISGSVTDQSPGQTCLGIPASGTAAIADKYMSQWMQYLYLQQPKPTDATGVSVTLTALDANGNIEDVGTTTSDAAGNFAFTWAPPIPGQYTVFAKFTGSDSYYSSNAETFVTFEQPTVTPTPIAAMLDNSTTQMYILAAAIAIIIAIAVVGVVLVLVIRKRP
jgi:outer membrane protein assembly factor BamB